MIDMVEMNIDLNSRCLRKVEIVGYCNSVEAGMIEVDMIVVDMIVVDMIEVDMVVLNMEWNYKLEGDP